MGAKTSVSIFAALDAKRPTFAHKKGTTQTFIFYPSREFTHSMDLSLLITGHKKSPRFTTRTKTKAYEKKYYYFFLRNSCTWSERTMFSWKV